MVSLLTVLAALALAGCSGDSDDDESQEADTSAAQPAETGGTTPDTGVTSAPADLRATAESIAAELDETLADLREVESLDELRDDLDSASALAQTWRDQLAAAPEDDELAEQRASLEEALEGLGASLEELSNRAAQAAVADLGTLARELTPDNLAGVQQVRTSLNAILAL